MATQALEKSFFGQSFGQIISWTNPLLDKSFFGQVEVSFKKL